MTSPAHTASAATERLLTDVRACTLCAAQLPLGPRPVLQMDPKARVLIAGQAPGSKVHASGIPFQDASGDRLRKWMGIDMQQRSTIRPVSPSCRWDFVIRARAKRAKPVTCHRVPNAQSPGEPS